GCNFPCYAFMMSKRFGRVKDYEDWRKPKIIENSIELLKKELASYRDKIQFIHLSFMTDPFMYNMETGELIQEISELTLDIIELINSNGIKVTTLTKGFYPEDLTEKKFSVNNEYGITLVSLNSDFKKKFESFTAPYDIRINSLNELHKAGCKTWVSIEPYPTPNLDPEAYNIEKVLKEVKFVDKMVFGKLNYNINSAMFKDNLLFYEKIAEKVISFCRKENIELHIKDGTPLCNRNNTLFL
ncbi:MAG: radical SAM protein, partial [Candidatus Eremiobacterota bacterium]